jgi:hypothetical protein
MVCGEDGLLVENGHQPDGGHLAEGGQLTQGRVTFSSMDKDEAEKVIQKALADIETLKHNQIKAWEKTEDKNPPSSFPIIILNTPGLKITASVTNVVEEILRTQRAELVSVLLGKGALND